MGESRGVPPPPPVLGLPRLIHHVRIQASGSTQIAEVQVTGSIQKYIFSFKLNGKKLYAVYNVGCFGLCDLPFLFTKIFRILVKHWRACAMPVVKFLDDGICFVAEEVFGAASEVEFYFEVWGGHLLFFFAV